MFSGREFLHKAFSAYRYTAQTLLVRLVDGEDASAHDFLCPDFFFLSKNQKDLKQSEGVIAGPVHRIIHSQRLLARSGKPGGQGFLRTTSGGDDFRQHRVAPARFFGCGRSQAWEGCSTQCDG